MRKAILNIGLDNNTLTPEQIIKKVRKNFGIESGRYIYIDIKTGIYNDQKEETLILSFESPYKLSTIVDKVERAAAVMDQECIAAKIDGNGLLIYRVNYNGQRYTFDNNLFLYL